MSSVTSRPSDSDGAQPYRSLDVRPPFQYCIPAWLPDGQRIVTGCFATSSVVIWNVTNGKLEGIPLRHGGILCDVAVTGDGRKIVSVSTDGSIKVWDVESQRLLKEWNHPTKSPSIAVSSNGHLVAASGNRVLIYTMEGKITRLINPGMPPYCISFSPSSDKLACSTFDGISVYDIGTGALVLAPSRVQGVIESLLWSHDGSRLFSRSLGSLICCWNADTGEQIGSPWLGDHVDQQFITFLSLSPDGSILASTTTGNLFQEDHIIQFWDTSGNLIGQPLRIQENCTGLCFSPSGDFVATTTMKEIYLWRVPTIVRRFSFDASVPPAPDLTPYISKEDRQHIAGGSFGDVYRSWCYHGSRKEIAVKALRFSFANGDTTSSGCHQMLRRELGIWRRLDHPNVVPFLGIAYGFGMNGAMSLVSSWMTNGSLHRFLEKYNDSLGVDHRLQFLLDTANGLHYLHSLSVVHGDLNCNNILLDEDYTARIADFGFASLVGNIPEALSYLQRSTARSGALRWVAPEQIDPEKGFDRTTKTDVYSFGCLSLQGRLLPTDMARSDFLLQVLSGKQPWSEVRQDVAILFCLAKGQKPSRPECQMLQDLHWNFIQQCWSPIERRPCAEAIVSFIRQSLNSCPQSRPLRAVATLRSSQSDSDYTGSLDHRTFEQQAQSTFSMLASASAPALQSSAFSVFDTPSFFPPSSTTSETASTRSAFSADIDWNSLTTFDPSMLSVLDEPSDVPMQTDTASSPFGQYPLPQSYKTIANNPFLMSFVDESPLVSSNTTSATSSLDYSTFNFPSSINLWPPVTKSPSRTQNNGQSDILHSHRSLDELFDSSTLVENSFISPVTLTNGSELPRTTESPDNIDALQAWRCVAYNDADIDELCAEFTNKARYGGTNVVLEPEGVQQLFEESLSSNRKKARLG